MNGNGSGFFTRLRQRKLVQWAVAYIAGAWVTLQMLDLIGGEFGWPGVIYGYPVTCKNGKYEIVQGLEIGEFSRTRMDATDKELREERHGVEDLLG